MATFSSLLYLVSQRVVGSVVKSFIQQSPIQAKGGRKRQRHKKKEDIDIALESSFQARSVCASQIKHLREAMTNFDKYTHAMKRREAREKRKRSTAIAKLRNSRNGPDKTLYKEILAPVTLVRSLFILIKSIT